MSRKRIIVDVDGTVVDTVTAYINHCRENYPLVVSKSKDLLDNSIWPYDVSKIFDFCSDDPLAFWNDLDYSQFSPVEGSIEFLEKASNYVDVVFASHIEGNHGKSKFEWLAKHFPFLSGVVFTREKWALEGSEIVAIFDDRPEHLKGFMPWKRYRSDISETEIQKDLSAVCMEGFNSWNELNLKKVLGL